MDKFQSLLSDIGDVKQSVIDTALRYFSSRILLAKTKEQASEIYHDAEMIPQTTTRVTLRENKGIILDGPLNTGVDAQSRIHLALKNGKPMAVKVSDKKSIEVEMGIWRKIQDAPFDCNLVGPMEEIMVKEDIDGERFSAPRSAIIMPLYVCSLSCFPFPLEGNFLLACGRSIENAIGYLHTQNIVHCDIKPSNIFLNHEGVCFLGDYDAASEIGSTFEKATLTHLPEDHLDFVATTKVDFSLLAVSLLEMAGILPNPPMRPLRSLKSLRCEAQKVKHGELQDFILYLLSK